MDEGRVAEEAPLTNPTGETLLFRVVVGGAVFDMAGPARLRIGRGLDCELCLDDPTVSACHAELAIGRELTIEDLGSTNGTHVRGERIPPRSPRTIELGEGLFVGSAYMVVQRRRLEVPAPPPVVVARGTGPIATSDPAPLVVCDPVMQELHLLARRFAVTHLAALIIGENGVGKQTLAREIYRCSALADRPFVRISCAAYDERTLEELLLDSGVLADASRTVLIEDVALLSSALQHRLLHAIEDAEHAGGGARLIAASALALEERVRAGSFRDELYFRLSAVTLNVPPLRERPTELEPLARAFVAGACRRMRRDPTALAPDACEALRAYGWPGNLHELRNAVERAAVLADGNPIDAHHLPMIRAASGKSRRPYPPPSEQLERQALVDALARANGNQADAARLLGISRRTLINRLERYKLPRPRKRH